MKKCMGVLVGVLMALMFVVNSAEAAMVYQQDFNNLNTDPLHNQDGWTCYNPPDICDVQTAVTYEGSKAVKTTGSIIAERIFSTSQSKALVKAAVRVASGSSGFIQITLFGPYPQRQNFGRVHFLSGGIYITNNVTDELIQTFSFDTWYFVEIETDSPNGRYRARINGGPWTSWKNFVDNLVGVNLAVVWMRNVASGTRYFDTFSVEDINTPTLKLPFKEGEIWWVSQGNGQGNHVGNLQYAWDFNWGSGEQDRGKPVLAPAAGWIVALVNNCPDPQPSGQCDVSPGWGNYVIIDYGSGYYGLLAHLRTVDVQLNQQVLQGQKVGTVGSSGDATYGPHIHYQTQNSSAINSPSIPSSFADVTINNGVPTGCNCSFVDCMTIDCNTLNTYCYKSKNIMR